ncbi:HK97 family phage prohead protease [Altererythrobacter lauratis]|uniref:HK97 family phage prohead protease n=1 Tax=Alteraurantiacibacter lauratis TaxID=2054627 RepID=A0ABV7EFN8_9SPHN
MSGRTLRLAGYAALFDVPDGAGDIIVKGAFARTLAGRRTATQHAAIPLYWQHRPEQRIGVVELAEEDERGLRIIAAIDNPQSRAMAALLSGAVNGLSFGYRARGFRPLPKGRVLEEIDLIEVSLVTHPLQAGARVHLVR